MNRPTAVLLLILMLFTSACSREVVITGEADGAPAGCGVQDVAQRLIGFADAFDQRDPQVVSEFFPANDSSISFRWYYASEGEKTGEESTVRSVEELPAYFERRQAQHEQLHFRRIKVNGYGGAGLVHFEFTVRRQADDVNGGIARDVVGKGALQCGNHTFVVLNIGDS